MRTLVLPIASLALAAAGLCSVAGAAAAATTFMVTSSADVVHGGCAGATCSLRDAVIAANANPGADTILVPAGTYTLTNTGRDEDAAATGDLDVTGSLEITTVGAGTVVIDGNGSDRIFDTFAAPAPITLTLDDLTVRDGNPSGSAFPSGGAVYTRDTTSLVLSGDTFSANSSETNGGAIYSQGDLTISGSTFSGNTAAKGGGAIYSRGMALGATEITNSSFDHNSAVTGGALDTAALQGIDTTVSGSSFTHNAAVAGPGGMGGPGATGRLSGFGGAILAGTSAEVSVTASRFTGNTAVGGGSAILLFDDASQPGEPTVTLDHSRLVGNTTPGATVYALTGTITAVRNWWGCNAGPAFPTNPGCDGAAGAHTTADPWIVLEHSASPATVGLGKSTTLTAGFQHNSDGSTNDPSTLGAFAGTPVTFANPVLGTLSGAQATIQANGAATATFTAGSTPGAGSADATVDSATSTAAVTIPRDTAGVTSINRLSPSASSTNADTVIFRVTFGAAVKGVSTADLALTRTGLAGASITDVKPVGAAPATQWDVTVTTGAGDGTLRLDLADDTGISHVVPPFTGGQSYTVDRTPPDTEMTATPPMSSSSRTAAFSFASTDGVAFQCSHDNGPFFGCTDPDKLASLAEGGHSFAVRAVDAAGNLDPTPASYTWTVDLTAPETTLGDTPPARSSSSDATFTFSSEGGATFECRLDASPFTACTSSRTLTGLTEGSHTFAVRAVDTAGNRDATPASYTWTVDLTAPDTTLGDTPPARSSSSDATFTFSSEGGATFECRLDASPFTACTSSRTLTGLTEGSHTFAVRAVDTAGNSDATPASYTWTVDLTAPETTLKATPPAMSSSSDAAFTFSSEEDDAAFECSLDQLAFTACISGLQVTGLTEGSHTFAVRAVDTAGNRDATPASYTWTVDLTAPETTLKATPPAMSSSSDAAFTFSSEEDDAAFECSLDQLAFTACTNSRTLTGLTEGSHTFAVRAVDTAGNRDATPASYTWTVDLTAPDTTLGDTPPALSSSRDATFTFSSEDGTTFECSLDQSPFTACTSSRTLTGLTEGSHTFAVRAVDTAGNSDATPASFAWTVDLNQAPVAVSDSFTTAEDQLLTTPAPGVLANDADPDAHEVLTAALVSGTTHGALSLQPDGAFTYSPAPDYSGPDSFSYRTHDSAGVQSEAVRVAISVTPVDDPPVIVSVRGGSCQHGAAASVRFDVSDPDTPLEQLVLSGVSSDDHTVQVTGFDGDTGRRSATVKGSPSGSATLTFTLTDGTSGITTTVGYRAGGHGADVLRGTPGPDILIGRGGADRINARSGNDLVCGGGGDDRLAGRGGDDVLDGRGGADLLNGGAGADAPPRLAPSRIGW